MIEVWNPGLQSTIQDLGRFGSAHLGISPCGALDEMAAKIANRLIGNIDNDAVIEITRQGAQLKFERDVWVAITGADMIPTLNDEPIKMWRAQHVTEGSLLKMGTAQTGERAYLAVSGGVLVEEVLGSRSTHLYGGFGGFQGRNLRRGDRLMVGSSSGHEILECNMRSLYLLRSEPFNVRVVPGPEWKWWNQEVVDRFKSKSYRVLDETNRNGVRLKGSSLVRIINGEMLSRGVAVGSIQVSNDGQPMILMQDQQTTGGYPVLANVIHADLWKVAQMKPRDTIQFEIINLETAWKINRSQREVISKVIVPRSPE